MAAVGVAALIGLVPVGWAGGQAVAPTDSEDSLRVLDRARGEQRRFEQTRRMQLPRDMGGGGGCEERIGRFCYWYQPGDGSMPPEPEAVRAGRRRLLADLEAVAARRPGDAWIIGQRVRYLVEDGQSDAAVALARRCTGRAWWCAALAGFALHAARDYVAADSAFRHALAAMPEEHRCRWTDLAPVLAGGVRGYDELPCRPARDSMNAMLWWLADPFIAEPGNDLRTEHYARHVMSHLLKDAESAHGIEWGPDLAELIVRYGWARSWTRPFGRPGRLEEPAVLGHEPAPSFWFFPALTWSDGSAAAAPAGATWDLGRERPPARYGPAYVQEFGSLERLQIARFRRPGSWLTVAAFDLADDTLVTGLDLVAAFAVGRDPETPPVVARKRAHTRTLAARSPWPPALMSLELRAPGAGRVARARVLASLDDIEDGALSDLLLIEPRALVLDSAEAALPLAHPGGPLRKGSRIGLYWEDYQRSAATFTRVELRVVRLRSRETPVAALGRRRCETAPPAAIALRWSDPPGQGGAGRSIVLDLQSLDRGWYRIVLSLGGSRGAVCATRDIEIADR